jgi:transcriptional regulator of aromatic amino acid metabolism
VARRPIPVGVSEQPDWLNAVAEATKARGTAEDEWQAAIVAAHIASYSTRAIARVAGVSHTSIAEIIREWTNDG